MFCIKCLWCTVVVHVVLVAAVADVCFLINDLIFCCFLHINKHKPAEHTTTCFCSVTVVLSVAEIRN